MHVNKQKILIADDSEINRALLIEILENQYDIVEAENGVEAIALLSRYKTEFSLLLLDIMMPKMDGFEVLAFIKKKKLECQPCGYYDLCGQFSCEYNTGI